jgi:hypothetical protein
MSETEILSELNGMTNNFDVAREKAVNKEVIWKGSIDDSRDVHAANSDLCEFANRQRACGESKRKHFGKGNTYHFFNCACGKNSGNRFTTKSFHTWRRLHKRVCPLLK